MSSEPSCGTMTIFIAAIALRIHMVTPVFLAILWVVALSPPFQPGLGHAVLSTNRPGGFERIGGGIAYVVNDSSD